MKILLTNNTIIELRNCVIIGNHPYYQRGIPKDLQDRFGNKKILKIKLDTNSRRSLASQVQEHTHNHTVLFKALREDPDMVVSEQKLVALTLLKSYRLKEGDGKIIDLLASDDPSVMDDPVFIQSANFYSDYQAKEESGTLTSVDRLAHQMLRTPLPMCLSEVLDIYFKNHPKGHDEAYKAKVKLVWNKLIDLIKDIPLVSIDRTLARKYRDLRLEQTKGKVNKSKIKTTTVDREINQIKAVITRVIREEELDIRNPFESLTISGLGKDANIREPLDISEITILLNACKENLDQTRKILAIQALTGARISEIAGLLKTDFIDGEIPHIFIRSNSGRSLKTKQSERLVPLVGLALTAIKDQLNSLPTDAIAMFPRYYDTNGVKRDAISATANKLLKSLGINKTTHSLRHTMRDMLREAGVTADIAHEIGGWSGQVIGDKYGKGFSLAIKRDALLKATRSISPNPNDHSIDSPEKELQRLNKEPTKGSQEEGKKGVKVVGGQTRTINQIEIEVISKDLWGDRLDSHK